MLPGSTMIRLLPMLWICSCIRAVAPAPTPTIAMTAATPMMMPSMVSAERVRFTLQRAQRDPHAGDELIHTAATSSARFRGKLLQILLRIARLRDPLIHLQPAVFEVNVADSSSSRHRDRASRRSW